MGGETLERGNVYGQELALEGEQERRSRRSRLAFVKIFLDGVPTASRSAAMLEPYLPLAESDEDNYGSLHLEPQVLADAVTRLDQLGFTVKIRSPDRRAEYDQRHRRNRSFYCFHVEAPN